jgi:hypothetical protein
VPSLEHNNQVKGESLDLVKYIDSNFEGPGFLPDVCNVYSTIMSLTPAKMVAHQFLSGIKVCIHNW